MNEKSRRGIESGNDGPLLEGNQSGHAPLNHHVPTGGTGVDGHHVPTGGYASIEDELDNAQRFPGDL